MLRSMFAVDVIPLVDYMLAFAVNAVQRDFVMAVVWHSSRAVHGQWQRDNKACESIRRGVFVRHSVSQMGTTNKRKKRPTAAAMHHHRETCSRRRVDNKRVL